MTKDPMRLAKALRKERGLQRQSEFAKSINISSTTLSKYENGHTYPQAGVVNNLAEFFQWNDEERMYLMPEVKAGIPELSKRYTIHSWYLNVNLSDLSEILGVTKGVAQNLKYNITDANSKKVHEFLKMDKEDIDRLLKKGVNKREPLDIELIDKVLKRYEHLTAADKLPVDDPDVKKMRKNVGAL